MKKKIYISIPIAHREIDEQKAHAARVERYLEDYYEVINPFNNGVPADAHPSEHMRADFKLLLEADAIFMCKGWEDSRGCMAEWTVATSCHMDVLYECGRAEYFR
jgi:hypothetical protein